MLNPDTILTAAIMAILPMAALSQQQPLMLDLKAATQLALRTSPQIGSAEAVADISKAQVGKAKSARYPSVGLESGYSYITEPTFFGDTPVLERDTVINRVVAQQIVYSGGQVQANLNRARYGFAAATQSARASRAEVIDSVSTVYFRGRQAKEAVAVADASVRSLEASRDAAQKLQESGVVTKSDVLRSEVALTSARDDLIAAKNNYNVALAALRTAIGLTQDACIELSPDANDTAADQACAAAPSERPEIAAAVASAKAADAGIKAAQAGRLPTVSLVADYFNEPVGAQFPRLTNTVMAGVLVKFSAFDGGLTRASIDEANAVSRKARQDLESQRRRVELEQQAAKLDLDSALSRVEATATQVQSAEESLRSLQVGYQEGMTPLTDVLSAQTALTAARVSRLAAIYDVKIAQVNLLKAYGQTDILTH